MYVWINFKEVLWMFDLTTSEGYETATCCSTASSELV